MPSQQVVGVVFIGVPLVGVGVFEAVSFSTNNLQSKLLYHHGQVSISRLFLPFLFLSFAKALLAGHAGFGLVANHTVTR